MYINFLLAAKSGITPQNIIDLQIILQNRNENLSDLINIDSLGHFEDKGWITSIKPKNKSQKPSELVRLSDKGKALLEDLQIPEINEDDLKIAQWLSAKYKESEKQIGNFKKTKLYIALFRVNTGIEKNCMAVLCNAFLEDADNFKYSQKLQYLFFKPENTYEKFDINQSKLYQYYLDRKEQFDKLFEKYE